MRGLKNGYGAGTTELHVIRCLSSVIPEYILLFVKNQSFISDAVATIQGVVGQQRIDANFIKKYFLPLPPLAEQKRIVSQIETLLGYVNTIDTDAETLDKSITLAKQKILDLAIRGKLVPQDPTDEPASELLKKIKAEKEALVKAGKLKKDKHESFIFKSDDNCYYEQLNGKTIDITVDIPFNLPSKWCWCRLGNIGSWGAGATPSRNNKEYYQNGTIPWLKTGDLNDGDIYSVPEYITEKALRETSVQLNPVGSILIAMYGATIGKVGVLQIPATTNQACCACSVFNGIDNRYLFFFLLSQKENFKILGGGGAQPNISKDKIINYLFPLPPMDEQLRIVQAITQYNSILELISK
jgi:type I restriction enzyme S subunit